MRLWACEFLALSSCNHSCAIQGFSAASVGFFLCQVLLWWVGEGVVRVDGFIHLQFWPLLVLAITRPWLPLWLNPVVFLHPLTGFSHSGHQLLRLKCWFCPSYHIVCYMRVAAWLLHCYCVRAVAGAVLPPISVIPLVLPPLLILIHLPLDVSCGALRCVCVLSRRSFIGLCFSDL